MIKLSKTKRTVSLVPTWKAAQIYIMCLENGSDENAKQGARNEIIRMAELLDEAQQEDTK